MSHKILHKFVLMPRFIFAPAAVKLFTERQGSKTKSAWLKRFFPFVLKLQIGRDVDLVPSPKRIMLTNKSNLCIS